ncbi:MAG: penicillin-binding transpeptidase domain-containing protein [Proteobacteria bacterium]|nr:penicillin-binding transpeptidase domain-containing protein [Pseudomonadota bacterium]
MIRNLINETDYSIIKKTNNLYSIFQVVVFLFFIIICIKLFLIISKPEYIKTNKIEELISPVLLDTNNNILAQTLIDHRIQVSKFDKNNYKNMQNLINDIRVIKPTVAEKINELTNNFFFVDRSPNEKQILETIYLGNPEIKFEKFYKRHYPFMQYTNNLIGQMNIDNEGKSLIEKYINSYNQNLNLSINIDLQKEVHDLLSEELKIYDANYALFILVDLLKEEILVNSYVHNNNYLDTKFDVSVMPSINHMYEFGSVFKPITVYSALNNGVLDLDEYFDVIKPLKYFSGDKFITDLFPVKVPIQTKDVLRESSNIGAVLINRKLDCKKQFKVDLEQLGLLLPVNIMDQIKSVNPLEPKSYTRKGNYCDNLAFGYALSVSPINLINAYARMITGKIDFKANIIKQKDFKDLILNAISSDINKLLYYANESNHKLYRSCLVAGKTGTADDKSIQKSIDQKKTLNNVTYISYFPYNQPRYLALTFMNGPKKSKSGYLTAGNTVKNSFYNIMEKILFSLELSSCKKSIETI